MKRRLFNLLAVVSLVLCVATVVLWVRTYWVRDAISRWETNSEHAETGWVLRSEPGSYGMSLWRATTTEGQESTGSGQGWQWDTASPGYTDDTWHGFRFERREDRFGSLSIKTIVIGAPLWLPTALFAAMPSWWLVRERRRRAALRAVGCCKNCGYDLRATPERCPECGAIPAKAEAISS